MNDRLITRLPLITALFIFCLSIKAYPCTTFCLKNDKQIVYGRNFDFKFGEGFIVSNRKNLSKVAFLQPNENPVRWISKYGSITFNQVGMEFPYEGMNEKGLVVAQMYLDEAKYPEKDNRTAISCLQWIQYQLDVSSTVDEVLTSDSFLRISENVPIGIHFLVCDKKGQMVIIEFLKGQMVYHSGDQLPLPLLQNQTYDVAQSNLKKCSGFGGDQTIPWKNINDFTWDYQKYDQCQSNAYAIAANRMNHYDATKTIVENAFDVLYSVSRDNWTQWSSVFDISNMKIYFKNSKRNQIVSIDFKDFSFEHNAVSKFLDIQSCSVDNVSGQFRDYSTEWNRKYAFESVNFMMKEGFMPVKIADKQIELQVKYPETIQ
jgi:penicillin V acylase-like amidase (Ntn superfamily)